MAQQSTNSKNYYDILGVPISADVKEIKKSYHELARLYHPDSNFYADIIDDKLSAQQIELFKVITCAYQTLIDPLKREQYDSSILPRLSRDSSEPWDDKEKSDFWSKKGASLSSNSDVKSNRRKAATFGQTGSKPFRATLHDGELSKSDLQNIRFNNLFNSKLPSRKKKNKLVPLLIGLCAGIFISIITVVNLGSDQSDQQTPEPGSSVTSNSTVTSDSENWKKSLDD